MLETLISSEKGEKAVMTIREFIEIDNDQMNALNQKQVDDLLKRMVPQANRRLNKLMDMEITPQALYSRLDENDELMPFKQKHRTLGKGKSELRNMQRFFRNKTSTVEGAKEVQTELVARVVGELDTSNIDYDEVLEFNDKYDMKMFWKAYNKLLERKDIVISTKNNPIAGAVASGEVQALMMRTLDNKMYKSSTWFQKKVAEIIKDMYEPPETGQSPLELIGNR